MQKKARFGARRNAEKARFGARRNAEKSTIWSTTKWRKKHVLEYDQTQKRAQFWYLTGLCPTKPEPHHDDVCDEWCSLVAVITSFVGSDNSWTTILFFLSWFWKVLEDARCETTRNCYILRWMDGFGAGKGLDFMVHHLGARFRKETLLLTVTAQGPFTMHTSFAFHLFFCLADRFVKLADRSSLLRICNHGVPRLHLSVFRMASHRLNQTVPLLGHHGAGIPWLHMATTHYRHPNFGYTPTCTPPRLPLTPSSTTHIGHACNPPVPAQPLFPPMPPTQSPPPPPPQGTMTPQRFTTTSPKSHSSTPPPSMSQIQKGYPVRPCEIPAMVHWKPDVDFHECRQSQWHRLPGNCSIQQILAVQRHWRDGPTTDSSLEISVSRAEQYMATSHSSRSRRLRPSLRQHRDDCLHRRVGAATQG